MKLELSGQILKKFSNVKFHENPSSGSLVPCGWTDGADRHDEANSSFSQFYEKMSEQHVSGQESLH